MPPCYIILRYHHQDVTNRLGQNVPSTFCLEYKNTTFTLSRYKCTPHFHLVNVGIFPLCHFSAISTMLRSKILNVLRTLLCEVQIIKSSLRNKETPHVILMNRYISHLHVIIKGYTWEKLHMSKSVHNIW